MGETRQAASGHPSLLAASCWLALLLVVAKGVSWTGDWPRGLAGRVATLVAFSWTDVLFALACGVVGETVALLARRFSAERAVRRCVIALLTVFAIYGLVSIGIFRYFNRPLTIQLLSLVQNVGAIRSSLAERLDWPLALAFLCVPVLFVWLATRRLPRAAVMTAVSLCAFWSVAGWMSFRAYLVEPRAEPVWRNPHTELFRSAVERLTSPRMISLPADIPAHYADDFRTFGARGITTLRHFNAAPGVARPRNTIVIVLESVGTKYLHLYGHPEEITPNITAASQHALVFDNIYAHASFTYASFRPINFSVYPGLPWRYALAEDVRPRPGTLAGQLKERGARTAYITSGDLDWGAQRWLLQNSGGFDLVAGANNLPCPLLSSWGTEDRCAFDRLIAWIDEEPARPFFAVCWTDQTHDPYRLSRDGRPAAEFLRPGVPFAEDLARYLTVVRELDENVGRLFAALRERGLADDTLVVITGDHGEAFADPHTQRGHAFTVYDEEARVPLILWNPRLFPEGSRVPTVGGHVDLNPTLADMLELPPHREWQGHSLFDPDRPNRAFLMAIAGGDVFGVRDGKWKYVYEAWNGRESLFNLEADPNEQLDLTRSEPAITLELRARVAGFVAFEDAFLWGREN